MRPDFCHAEAEQKPTLCGERRSGRYLETEAPEKGGRTGGLARQESRWVYKGENLRISIGRGGSLQ